MQNKLITRYERGFVWPWEQSARFNRETERLTKIARHSEDERLKKEAKEKLYVKR